MLDPAEFNTLYDVRTLKHRFETGDLTPAQYQAHLEALEDDSAEAVESDVRFVNTFESKGDAAE